LRLCMWSKCSWLKPPFIWVGTLQVLLGFRCLLECLFEVQKTIGSGGARMIPWFLETSQLTSISSSLPIRRVQVACSSPQRPIIANCIASANEKWAGLNKHRRVTSDWLPGSAQSRHEQATAPLGQEGSSGRSPVQLLLDLRIKILLFFFCEHFAFTPLSHP